LLNKNVSFLSAKHLLLLFCINLLIGCEQLNDPYQAFDKGDYETAYASFYKLAKEEENLVAINYLGVMHYLGYGRKRDVQAARQWFEIAANKGFAGAQFNLGNIYANGEGVQLDFTKAYMWFYIANEFGHEQAKKRMGLLLMNHKLFPNQAMSAREQAENFINASKGEYSQQVTE
jgi:TPR repeat protein